MTFMFRGAIDIDRRTLSSVLAGSVVGLTRPPQKFFGHPSSELAARNDFNSNGPELPALTPSLGAACMNRHLHQPALLKELALAW
jgi:hypothetical protein